MLLSKHKQILNCYLSKYTLYTFVDIDATGVSDESIWLYLFVVAHFQQTTNSFYEHS